MQAGAKRIPCAASLKIELTGFVLIGLTDREMMLSLLSKQPYLWSTLKA